ncbi:MAG: sensor histidine kinase [Monoglobaceae bacterium]
MINDLKATYSNENIDPVRISQWAIDNLMEKTSPYLQTLMYVKNLEPEQLECIYKTKLYITKTYSDIHNIAELYGADDAVSSLKFASYNIEHFLNAATKQILKMFDKYNIDILFDCSKTSKNVYLDIRRTSLILFNLISNSIIHTKNKEKIIKISAYHRGDDFVLSVSDNGQGIKPSMRDNLFTISDKLLSSKFMDRTGSGLILTGIGLPVAQKSAKDMGGTLVYIPSKSGAVFELSVPQHKHNMTFGEIINYEPTQYEYELYFSSAILFLEQINE